VAAAKGTLGYFVRSRNLRWLILALFFCSGATALVYEVIWAKFLSQMFGSTIYAQTVVLAAFMGGLALGNRILGCWADRLQRPVRIYGYFEIAIGLYAFFFPTFNLLADRVFVAAGAGIAEHTGWLLALKGSLSAALLLGPTILMGGTLPLLSAWLQKTSMDAGRRTALFYSINSLGAVLGATLAGFWLVQNLGMVISLQATAFVNVLVGATAGLLGGSRLLGNAAGTGSVTTDTTDTIASWKWHWAGVIVAMTGAVSMGLEVLASRSLAMIFGSSLQSFAVVLIAFILGIGLGSAWIASPQCRESFSKKLIVLLLCAAAAWVTVLVFNLERCVDFYRIARTGLGHTSVGYMYYEFLTVGIALVVLGVPAMCIGAVLPLMIRVVSREGKLLGARVGALLTWNTVGAVAGTLLTGFLLMPMAGLRNSFGVLALVLALAALVVARWQRWRTGMVGGVVVIGLTGCLFAFGGESWRYVMSAGVFRMREAEFFPMAMPLWKQHTTILFYDDAPDATVMVKQGDGIGALAEVTLKINGKTDASSHGDLSTQLLLAHLPMLARPGAKDVFIFGLGSGISAGALLAYPVERITVAENCEPVIRASQFFTNWNHHVLDDPRTHLWYEDARTVLKLNPQSYDVIIAEPSNPWTVGIGSVFSCEFYQLAASRLKPGGIMAQWFHVYEMNDGVVSLVLRTFNSVFPYVEIWDPGGGDIVMLGSLQPWQAGPEVFRQSFGFTGVRSDLDSIGIHSPEALLARQLASQRTAFAIAGDGPIQSDLFPVLEYAAPRAFYIGINAKVFERFDERTRQQAVAPPDKLTTLHSLTVADVRSVFLPFSTVNRELLDSLLGREAGANVPCVFKTNAPPATSEGSDESTATLNRAITALNTSDLKQAGQLAALAQQQNPTNSQAAYVTRIIDREQQLQQAADRHLTR
jgi:predicted membrane-bound spermidine synthase